MICVSEEALKTSADGWVEGFSCSTGEFGLFPLSLVTRARESDTWTLHCKIQVCNPTVTSSSSVTTVNAAMPTEKDSNISAVDDDVGCDNNHTTANNGVNKPKTQEEVNADNLHKYIARIIVTDTNQCVQTQAPSQQQKLIVLRHGERVDFTFANWTKNCFLANGQYQRLDLNLPKTLPYRQSPHTAWQHDSPSTMVGMHQARLTGDQLCEIDIGIGVAYTSPAFRCIQTCHAMLEGMQLQQTVKIRIEPALFEWCGWYPGPIPDFCDIDELVKYGFNIDTDYVPLIRAAELSIQHKNETIGEFYTRNHRVSEMAVKNSSEFDMNAS